MKILVLTLRRKSRADIEGVCNVNSKSKVEDIINKEDISAVLEIEKIFKITTRTTINQTIDVIRFLLVSNETKLKYITVNIDENDGDLN